MGLFDYVVGVPDVTCACGELVTGWQSKDRNCSMENVHFNMVENFYSYCETCGRFYEFRYKRPKTLEDYEMTSYQTDLGTKKGKVR